MSLAKFGEFSAIISLTDFSDLPPLSSPSWNVMTQMLDILLSISLLLMGGDRSSVSSRVSTDPAEQRRWVHDSPAWVEVQAPHSAFAAWVGVGPQCFLWSLAGLERLFSESAIFCFSSSFGYRCQVLAGAFFFFSLFTSLGIFSFFISNSRVYEAEIKSKELTTCCSSGPKVSDLLSSLHLLESSCGCYQYTLVYILLSIYMLCMLYVYIYLHTHHTVSKVFIVLMGRIGKSPFTSCLQEKTVSALTFKSVLGRTAACEVLK